MSQIAENLALIRQKIRKAAQSAGRAQEAVQLVAVSKKQPPERITAALTAGQRLFGENRVQEAQDHWTDLKARDPAITLHLIGPLQTNKVRDAVALFDVIETLDRESLADALAAEMIRQNRFLPCFIQVNTGAEPQKAGVLPENLPALLNYARGKGLSVTGLMVLPPMREPPALHFALLKKLAARHDLPELSMGMSADFEKAVPLGATYVRVGTALFGNRD
ncbi:MAG: YggS family pyridoxal phosphate-dependent enzyme [Alphaproteobacteria bacterium]|nr:YggS family pyridoxal phosphate-dependent enzyme [Alphaproteobacteria bacterium]